MTTEHDQHYDVSGYVQRAFDVEEELEERERSDVLRLRESLAPNQDTEQLRQLAASQQDLHAAIDNKSEIYTRVTDKIIADLEKGTLTWMQPWQAGHAGPVSRPRRSNGTPYQGINILLLWTASLENDYSAPIWMTYKQAQELGGQIRKGEKGTHVVYANAFTKTETDDTGEEVEKRIPFLKTYTVFNVEQIDGLSGHFSAPAHPVPHENGRIAAAEAFFAATGATIRHGGNHAHYRPDLDLVQMPPFAAFRDSAAYYGTLAHEITHWTKHAARLDREFGRKRFGDEGYAMEELVAELGAAFVCADLGIAPEPREETAAYIQSWLKVLRNDKHAIFTAASHAQKAADFLHRTTEKAEAPDERDVRAFHGAGDAPVEPPSVVSSEQPPAPAKHKGGRPKKTG